MAKIVAYHAITAAARNISMAASGVVIVIKRESISSSRLACMRKRRSVVAAAQRNIYRSMAAHQAASGVMRRMAAQA